MRNRNSKLLRENIEAGDLKRLVHHELHIDEYKSKMGDDSDIIVISFKVSGKEPSADLVSFIEKGYQDVLDADVSSGEKEGGDYLVFVELERNKKFPELLVQMMEDIMNLTGQKLTDWRFRYYHDTKDHELTLDNLKSVIPLTVKDYERKFGSDKDIQSMKDAAGIKNNKKAPKNDFTESLRRIAGLS